MSFDSLLNTTCTIQSRTIAQDTAGQEIETWADAVTSVACRLDPLGQERKEVPAVIWQEATNKLFLRNPSSVTLSVKTHRIVVGGISYEILWIPKYNNSTEVHHIELLLQQKDNG